MNGVYSVKITDIRTYLMDAGWPQCNEDTKREEKGGWSARNWLFVKICTDEEIYGIGLATRCRDRHSRHYAAPRW